MRINLPLLSMTLLLPMMLAACGGRAATPAAEMPHDQTVIPEETMSHETSTPDAMLPHDSTPTTEAVMAGPAWFGATLTDVRTGQTFSLNDFRGKVILVETMAVWCPKCYDQQAEIQSLHALIGAREDFISVSLDIDPHEDSGILQSYLGQTGFDWLYAVTPADVAREIALAYGDQFLNPPSTPVLIIDRHGLAHPLPFGLKRAHDLMQAIQPYLDESL